MEANTVAEHVTNMHNAENQGELADAAARMIATSHDNVIKAVGELRGEIQSKHRWMVGLVIGLTGLILVVLQSLSQTS